jgi:FMN phosphatase YigB (HAD superfamily)
MTQLALFDLDHTLLPIDSDHEWGRFLVKTGVVDPAHYASEKEFKEKIRVLNGSQQTPLNEALIQLVKERHTFDHRASKILSVIAQIKQKLII